MITISSGTGGSAARQVPQTSGRAFNGEFTINSGDTVVIAGLKTHTISKTINKVPLFGDIPGLGKLFRNTSDSKQNNYLTIFITATILDDNNNPRIPEGHITTKDKYPDDENTWMSAEPNSQNLMRNSLIGDKTMINAKREALDLRTEQANRIIANRLKLETQAEALTSAYEQQSTELQDLENQKKQLKKKSTSDGSIERLKADIDTKLTKTKTDREALAKELVECRVGLEKLAKQEVDATKAKEKAETDYTKALKDSILKPAVLPNSQKPAGKSAEDVNNTLDKNKTLLNNL